MGPIGPGPLGPTNEWAQWARALGPNESPRALLEIAQQTIKQITNSMNPLDGPNRAGLGPTNEWAQWARALGPNESPKATPQNGPMNFLFPKLDGLLGE